MYLSTVSQQEVLWGGGRGGNGRLLKCLSFCNGCQRHLVILLPSTGWACSYNHEYYAGIISSADPLHPVMFFVMRQRENKQQAAPSLKPRWLIREKCKLQWLHNGGKYRIILFLNTTWSYTQIICNQNLQEATNCEHCSYRGCKGRLTPLLLFFY